MLRKWSLCNKWTLEDQIVVLIAFNAKVIHMHIDQPQEILLFVLLDMVPTLIRTESFTIVTVDFN